MASVDSISLDSIRRSVSKTEDVWFLSGPTGPSDALQHTPIDRQPFVVGRQSGTSMKLQFRTVSGNHAELRVIDGHLVIQDLNSTNGTYVNGTRITEATAVSNEDLIHFAEAPFRIRRQSPTGMTAGTISENVCDQALALVQFDRLMSQRLVRPHFQPIVTLKGARPIGFEILGRGSVFGLESVGAMFQAAEQLNLEVELSRLLRWEGLRVGRELPDQPTLFVNTHPKEMEDGHALIDSLSKVRSMATNTKIVLEIHEAAVTDPALMRRLHASIKDLNIQLAYDDFGAGQARLAELIEARPEFVKFDIGLIRGIEVGDTNRMRMLQSLVNMVQDLEIAALAEGIETAEEANACLELGFDLAQGYYYGRPAPA
ncbi:EAL domain, c-di-GMP-specific phosphodiesterase class I (or its enzymatically inactive variant) [Neorhodopirellula lusitana]|uniref:EAL domain, c-di-GMP-specific phosphodiesterase class I (Or its enzymatically inactive variant) n=1 Tax=Neorhodopirellula lusitana TaxID=445327 RepID=A0ABY1Q217_9BACT|nr:EAL domain-containing protein [Neorhodopirellula lusitana]SMP53497.1 EAL domain, c-di-GMP-specific phosphodiesterase class I (or its enzymatically inactive variant) [Neorhodopirellula lusitana]